MDVIVYFTIFCIGTLFGSFFTLAVYRIPRHENIVYGRSHCTTCEHRLGFFDLIPVLSYLFLRGRCRYCGEKIRIRYLLLEVFSGFVFLTIALTHGYGNIIELVLLYLFVAGMFIIGGISKENHYIPNGLCVYEFVVAMLHFVFSFITQQIYLTYLLGAFVIPFLILISHWCFQKWVKGKTIKPLQNGEVNDLFVIGLMLGFPMQIMGMVLSYLIGWIRKRKCATQEVARGYDLSIAISLLVIVEPYLEQWLQCFKV